MTDSDLARWALYLMGSVVLTLAVHARSVGVGKAATGLGIAGLALLLVAYGGELSFIHRHAVGRVGVWIGTAVVTVFAALEVRREHSLRTDLRGRSRLPVITFGSWCTAAFSLFGACCAAFESGGTFCSGLAVWCLVVWATLGVSSLLIAQNMAARGGDRAWVGWLFALWSLVVFALPILGLLGGNVAVADAAIFAGLFLPILGPFVAVYLVGAGPIPRDLGHVPVEEEDAG